MKIQRRRFLKLITGAAALPSLLSETSIGQETYPSRPIRLIVGFTPGTAADITARAFGNIAADILSQKIIVENKPGAGSSLAAEYVARAPKDGYTLFLVTLSTVTSEAMKSHPSIDLVRDFEPVSLLASGAIVLVVNPQSNLHSVVDLIALAKSKPGEISAPMLASAASHTWQPNSLRNVPGSS